jgi:hypothetical protein
MAASSPDSGVAGDCAATAKAWGKLLEEAYAKGQPGRVKQPNRGQRR